MIECVGHSGIVLKSLCLLSTDDIPWDPLRGGPGAPVREVYRESFEEVTLYQLLGLQCAGIQVVSVGDQWRRVDEAPGATTRIMRRVDLVGFVLDPSQSVAIDGVVCRGLSCDTLRLARSAYASLSTSAPHPQPVLVDVPPMTTAWDQSALW